MRWFSFVIILLAVTLLEAGNLLNMFAFGNGAIRPSVLITLLVYYALVCQPYEAIHCSFLIGLAADLAAGLLGPHTLCYGLIGVLLNQLRQTLTTHRVILTALFVFITFMVTEIPSYWIGLLKSGQSRVGIYSILFLRGLYSAIISPFIWSALSRLSGWSKIGYSSSRRLYH